jgi:hypothetical protein
MTAPA